ncbi:DUF3179 domain-containing protein [Curvivirga sp.]|uniref:DUF3179 domain-containing protein n=1 Tax=Curvivirga sp. TaxID=2856848 RepID=UPI003B598AF1
MRSIITLFLICLGVIASFDVVGAEKDWRNSWPNTDFSKYNVDLSEILSGGPTKDGIPPIDNPIFIQASQNQVIEPNEPVISIIHNDIAKAYPLRIMMWHEIVNDEIGDLPIAVTFCPLCNASIVYDRRLNNEIYTFGTTGKLRHSDLIMWDRQTESWWQQFSGEAIVGELTGSELTVIPSRLESFKKFLARTDENALLLVPNDQNMRPYGSNPYSRYDGGYPFLYKGDLPENIKPLERVVSLSDRKQAWSFSYLKEHGQITTDENIEITWEAGQVSALDTEWIPNGKDVGNIIVRQNGKDIPYFVEFAFAFYAFHPEAPIHNIENSNINQ